MEGGLGLGSEELQQRQLGKDLSDIQAFFGSTCGIRVDAMG